MRLRILECLMICVCLPLAAAFLYWKTDVPLMPIKCALLAVAFILLWRDPSFDRREFFRFDAFSAGWRGVVKRFLVLAAVLGAVFIVLKPAAPFRFPRQHPVAWLAFVIFAPVAPAYPEEFLFRVFFFHRYGVLFRRPWLRTVASAAVFSIAHLYLANAWAIALAFLGGILFAHTFVKSRSAVLVSFEHGLWAAYLFTIGLGPFFYPHLD